MQVGLLAKYNITINDSVLKQLEDGPLAWKALKKKVFQKCALPSLLTQRIYPAACMSCLERPERAEALVKEVSRQESWQVLLAWPCCRARRAHTHPARPHALPVHLQAINHPARVQEGAAGAPAAGGGDRHQAPQRRVRGEGGGLWQVLPAPRSLCPGQPTPHSGPCACPGCQPCSQLACIQAPRAACPAFNKPLQAKLLCQEAVLIEVLLPQLLMMSSRICGAQQSWTSEPGLRHTCSCR